MRVFTYTKTLNTNLDEAISKMAYEISTKVLAKDHEILISFSGGNAVPNDNMIKIPGNPFLFSPKLRALLREFHAELILYVPRASASLATFIHSQQLKQITKAKKLVMLALQPNDFNVISQRFATFLKPDLVLTASTKTRDALINLGCPSKFIPMGVDCHKFTPVTEDEKGKLRIKHGLDVHVFTILHVGHLNVKRNIRLLKNLQHIDQQVIIIGSTSTPQDVVLCEELRAVGIKIYTEFMDRVEEFYQLADCYVFPTVSESSCIGVPLSVQEAMACNLPIVTMKFGGLMDVYPEEKDGLLYANDEDEFEAKVDYVRQNKCSLSAKTRGTVQAFSYDKWALDINELLESIVNTL